MILYRPVGLNELHLIYESGMGIFPPRLPEQPIFYPVLNYAYAVQIARDWNTKSNPFAGYVTEFVVDDVYVTQFDRKIVGARKHEELWVPAEQLDTFNQHMQGRIAVTGAYFGPEFQGCIPSQGHLQDQNVATQLETLVALGEQDYMMLRDEIQLNHMTTFLYFPFWKTLATTQHHNTLAAIAMIWSELFPAIMLPSTRNDKIQ